MEYKFAYRWSSSCRQGPSRLRSLWISSYPPYQLLEKMLAYQLPDCINWKIKMNNKRFLNECNIFRTTYDGAVCGSSSWFVYWFTMTVLLLLLTFTVFFLVLLASANQFWSVFFRLNNSFLRSFSFGRYVLVSDRTPMKIASDKSNIFNSSKYVMLKFILPRFYSTSTLMKL